MEDDIKKYKDIVRDLNKKINKLKVETDDHQGRVDDLEGTLMVCLFKFTFKIAESCKFQLST